ncbi:MAG TPA: fructose-bisphosphatase class II [Thermoleophilaceae bacterium]|nr:fructose-bisphosphatase class II [Thermoleophilaceae bacterium]
MTTLTERPGAIRSVSRLEPVALAATRAAAIACQRWVGRGDPHSADAAATDAMRAALAKAPGIGNVVIGEGEKDAAPMLYNGEQVGNSDGTRFDIAVDPLECTKACAAGLPGSLATIAIAAPGTLWAPGPALYIEKLVVGAAARDAIDITARPEDTAVAVAWALEKTPQTLRAVVLGKPRHAELIGRLREMGVHVSTPADGDVAGALEVLLPDGSADLLVGVGGTPEGVLTACAVRALDGGMEARLAPQRQAESDALADAGVELERVLGLEDLAPGESLFVATGVTSGSIARGPARVGRAWRTDSIVISDGSVRRVLETSFDRDPKRRA